MSEQLPGFKTRAQAVAAGKRFFVRASGTLGAEGRDFHVVQNNVDRWEFRDGRRKRPVTHPDREGKGGERP